MADTITEWGVKDGYFVDDAEAEAFRAELKHLILTRRRRSTRRSGSTSACPAARNRLRPASSLPSTTPWTSILNWYVEEGTIFKGGSGAGINLSNIRSSSSA